MSFCCWVKLNEINRTQTLFSSRKKTGAGLTIFILSGNQLRFDNGNDQNSSANQTTFNYIFASSVWYHIAVIQTNTQKKLYINGVLQQSVNKASANLGNNSATKCTIGASGANNATGNWLKGYLNDVRVYNHALSDKEVEEISRGLILHYKLDDPYIESTTNLFKPKPCTGGENWTASGNGVKIDWAANAKDTYWYLQLADGVTLVQGDTYTFSCRCSGIGTTTVMFRWCNVAGYDIYLHNGWNQYTFSMPSKNIKHPFFDDINRDASLSNLQIYDFQLEKKGYATPYTSSTRNLNIIYDSSGYGNHGTINGSLETVATSALYECSSYFDGNTSAIQTPNLATMITDRNYTISCWTYKTQIGSKNYQTIYGGPPGFELEARSSNSTSPLFRLHNWGGGTTPYEFNKWYHFCFVHNDMNSKLYINGELKITGSSTNIQSGNYFIGAWNTSTQQNYDGNISDFRIYCTALTEDQIKELYNTSMSIDDQGNIYARELVE